MEGFVEVESVSNEELRKLKGIVVYIEENDSYILTKNIVSYPRDIADAFHVSVNIIRCKNGERLKFEVYSQAGDFLSRHVSDVIVTKILVEK